VGAVALLAGLLCTLVARAPVAAAPSAARDAPLIDVVEVDGVIDQTLAGYVTATLSKARREGSELVVIQLDTPGGLGVSMEQIVQTISNAGVPVAVWVGPAGATASSAGMFIAYAAPILAMAPGTTIGAATPVDLGGDDLTAKARNTAEARLAALADRWGRDVGFARAAVRDGAVAAVLATPGPIPGGAPGPTAEAIPESLPPGTQADDVLLLDPRAAVDRGITDLVAASLPELFAAVDGRAVAPAAGGGEPRTLDLDPARVTVRFHNLGLVQRILHTVANPTLAYLLLVGGALALLFELFQPGFGVAGVSGAVLFGLGLYGLSVLPVNWLAFALLLGGLALLAVDLAIAGFGPLTAGGTLAVAAGSLLLFGGAPILRPSRWVVAAVVLGTVGFFVVVMTTVLRAQGGRPLVGSQELLGQVGVVRSILNPEGHVFVSGALWRARAPDEAGPVRTGTRVRVVGLADGLTLYVELLEAEEPTAETALR
jgi:membrane-bound serine protease (ClpP class)